MFQDLSLTVHAGDKISLVGRNGSGKSSLLRIIQGIDSPEDGAVKRRKHLTVGYCAQDPVLDESLTAVETVLASGSAAAQAARQYAQSATESADNLASQSLDQATAQMEAMGAWEIEDRARDALKAAGVIKLEAKIGSMSGGQRRRVALAAALLSEPQLLILDEPTNHLDMQAIAWLETELSKSDTSLIMVTHDRWFMETVCTRLVELEQGSAHAHAFGGRGSYDRYRQAREERRIAATNAAMAARTQLRKESEWMAKQPKARSVKQAARVARFYDLSAAASSAPREEAALDLGGPNAARRQGSKVLVMEAAAANIGDRSIVCDFNYDFQPRERLGLVGPNGSGKTTLLRMLADQAPLAAGSRQQGATTSIGYLPQQPDPVRPDISAIQYIREVASAGAQGPMYEGADSPEHLLERLGFARPRQLQLVQTLSGGEVRRLQLGAVLAARPNFLLLDEPTNDLDVLTVEQLEALLQDWPGSLVLASHDRSLLDRVAGRLLVLQGDQAVRLFDGSYAEYADYEVQRRASEQAREAAARKQAQKALAAVRELQPAAGEAVRQQPPQLQRKPARLGYREQQEYAQLERDIDALSQQQQQLDRKLAAMSSSSNGNSSHHTELAAASAQLAQLSTMLDEKTERWLELADVAEAAGQLAAR